MKRSDFRFHEQLRVRWAEVDLQKIVFNGHYLMYFDTAVAGYWRGMALPYQSTMVQLAGDLFVRKATVEYHASAEYDDVLDVGMRCDRVGQSSIRFVACVFRNEDALVSGELVYVFADPHLKVSRPVPGPLRDAFTAFEQGAPMVAYRTESVSAPFNADSRAAGQSQAFTLVGSNRLGETICKARWTREASADGRFIARLDHLEVVHALQRSGLGSQAMGALEDEAVRMGCHQLRVCVPGAWVGTLTRQGFVPAAIQAPLPSSEGREMIKILGTGP